MRLARAFANTVYDYHPAVTTMWIIALGMLIYFPQYRASARDISMYIRIRWNVFFYPTVIRRLDC